LDNLGCCAASALQNWDCGPQHLACNALGWPHKKHKILCCRSCGPKAGPAQGFLYLPTNQAWNIYYWAAAGTSGPLWVPPHRTGIAARNT